MTYRRMEVDHPTCPSRSTFQRAASGDEVPAWETVVWFWMACFIHTPLGRSGHDPLQRLWRLARMEERDKLHVPAPRPEYLADHRVLSEHLMRLYERSGAPPYSLMLRLGRDPEALPERSFRRIVMRETIPAHKAQMRAFIRGCGVKTEKEEKEWLEAWDKAVFTRWSGLPSVVFATAEEVERLRLG